MPRAVARVTRASVVARASRTRRELLALAGACAGRARVESARADAIDEDFYATWTYARPADVIPFVERFATRGDPASVLRAYDAFGERYPSYKLGAAKAALYGEEVLARIDPLTCCVEIGTFLGYSAIATAMRMTAPGAEMMCVEYEPRHAEVARWAIAYAGLGDRVTVLTRAGSESADAARAFVDRVKGVGQGVDVLFLDHAKERYLPDLQLYERAGVVTRGSVVVADNVIYPGAPGYLEYVDSAAKRYDTRLIEAMFEYDQVWKPDWVPQKDALSVSVRL